MTNWLLLLASYLPLMCSSVSALIMIYFIMSAMCGHKGKKYVYILYGFYVFFVQKFFLSLYLKEKYGNEMWFHILFLTLFAIGICISLTVLNYCFRGGLVKVLLISIFGEIITIFFIWAGIFLIDISRFMTHTAASKGIDTVAGSILALVMFFILFHYAGPLMKRYRKMNTQYSFFCILCAVIYMIAGVMSHVSWLYSPEMKEVVRLSFFGVFASCILLFMLFVYSIRYQRELKKNILFLRENKNRMEAWLDKVEKQEMELESSQENIKNALASVIAMESQSERYEKIREYADTLKEKHDKVEAGVYCQDCQVDALFVSVREKCRQEGIGTDFLFQNYNRGNIREDDLVRILLKVLILGINGLRLSEPGENNRVLTLHAASLKNQLIIIMRAAGGGKIEVRKKDFREYIEQYNGVMEVNRKGKDTEIVMTLQSQL